jgi:uncharacterized Zn ribbon protein
MRNIPFVLTCVIVSLTCGSLYSDDDHNLENKVQLNWKKRQLEFQNCEIKYHYLETKLEGDIIYDFNNYYLRSGDKYLSIDNEKVNDENNTIKTTKKIRCIGCTHIDYFVDAYNDGKPEFFSKHHYFKYEHNPVGFGISTLPLGCKLSDDTSDMIFMKEDFYDHQFSKDKYGRVHMKAKQKNTNANLEIHFDQDDRLMKIHFFNSINSFRISLENVYDEKAESFFLPTTCKIQKTTNKGTKNVILTVLSQKYGAAVDISQFNPKTMNLKDGHLYQYYNEKNSVEDKYWIHGILVTKIPKGYQLPDDAHEDYHLINKPSEQVSVRKSSSLSNNYLYLVLSVFALLAGLFAFYRYFRKSAS